MRSGRNTQGASTLSNVSLSQKLNLTEAKIVKCLDSIDLPSRYVEGTMLILHIFCIFEILHNKKKQLSQKYK